MAEKSANGEEIKSIRKQLTHPANTEAKKIYKGSFKRIFKYKRFYLDFENRLIEKTQFCICYEMVEKICWAFYYFWLPASCSLASFGCHGIFCT